MRTTYTRVMDLNRELMAEHMKRYSNQQALLDSLKQVCVSLCHVCAQPSHSSPPAYSLNP